MRSSSWLTLAVLVLAFYQGPPVLSSAIDAGGDSGAHGPLRIAADDRGGRWRNVGDTDEERAEFEPPTSPATDRNATCPQCACGALGKNLGIIGGNATYVNQYPWMALVLFKHKSKTFCGGTLINNKYVLTAAHNVDWTDRDNIIVRLSEHDRHTTAEEQSKDYEVLEVIIHELWSSRDLANDIALLRLDGEVMIFSPDSRIHPVCLPIRGESYDHYEGVVTGWGTTDNRRSLPDVLQQLRVPIMSNEECYKWTAKKGVAMRDTWMCTGYLEGGKNPCHGDSGGPLHIGNHSAYYLVGIISFHFRPYCAQPKSPEVYTRVNKYLDWIADHTKDACPCNNVFDPSKNH